jgi:hypothetical protein
MHGSTFREGNKGYCGMLDQKRRHHRVQIQVRWTLLFYAMLFSPLGLGAKTTITGLTRLCREFESAGKIDLCFFATPADHGDSTAYNNDMLANLVIIAQESLACNSCATMVSF